MGKKILVVDDEEDILKILLLRLEKAGYEVMAARNGQEALDLAHHISPDLILMDVYLPDINGDDIARVMKNDKRLKHIPILLISATTTTISDLAEDCGAQGYLGKPFEPEELLQAVNKILG